MRWVLKRKGLFGKAGEAVAFFHIDKCRVLAKMSYEHLFITGR